MRAACDAAIYDSKCEQSHGVGRSMVASPKRLLSASATAVSFSCNIEAKSNRRRTSPCEISSLKLPGFPSLPIRCECHCLGRPSRAMTRLGSCRALLPAASGPPCRNLMAVDALHRSCGFTPCYAHIGPCWDVRASSRSTEIITQPEWPVPLRIGSNSRVGVGSNVFPMEFGVRGGDAGLVQSRLR